MSSFPLPPSTPHTFEWNGSEYWQKRKVCVPLWAYASLHFHLTQEKNKTAVLSQLPERKPPPCPARTTFSRWGRRNNRQKTLFSMSRFWWVTRTKTRPFCRCVSRMRLFLSSSLQLPKSGLWLETRDVFHVDYNMLCQHINFHTTLQTTVEFIGENTLPGMTKATCSISFCSVSAIGAMEISFPFSASRWKVAISKNHLCFSPNPSLCRKGLLGFLGSIRWW